jgi:hypothetical protein
VAAPNAYTPAVMNSTAFHDPVSERRRFKSKGNLNAVQHEC